MREIYLLSHGDSLNKIKHEFNVEISLSQSKEKLFGYNYVDLNKGSQEVYVVRNYYPYIVYNVKKEDTLIDIMSKGFDVNGVVEITEGDKLILHKPKSIRYIVKPLESLQDIAYKFGVNKEDIIDTNKLITDKLFVGQILWI